MCENVTTQTHECASLTNTAKTYSKQVFCVVNWDEQTMKHAPALHLVLDTG